MAAFERQVAEDRALHFKGTARIPFGALAFPNPLRREDSKSTKGLQSDFKRNGCLNHEVKYSISAIIEDFTLASELGRLGISAEEFRAPSRTNPPMLHLRPGLKLEGLDGQHRILAGMGALRLSSEQWWTVDLYGTGVCKPHVDWIRPNISSGLADKTKQRLREGYYSDYTDGEIFRQIRFCSFQNDRIGMTRWRGRLSQSKSRDFASLQKRPILMKALDSILAYRAIWKDFRFGSMDVFSTLSCDEVRCPLLPPAVF